VRFRFTKHGKVRWTSHRDVARMWERALRRAEVPVQRTEGFSPRPRISFGLALSTGHESLGEYLDVDVAAPATGEGAVEIDGLPARLSPALPVGIDVVAAVEVDPRAPSLQQDVTSCSWQIEVPGLDEATATSAIEAAMAASEIVATRTRKGADVVDDVRPAMLHVAVAGPSAAGDGVLLLADLATQPRSLRPAELLSAVLPGAEEGRVVRTHQWIDHHGERTEPIPLDGAPPVSHLLGACG
jgi:radical SAM-linked protein